MSITVTAQSTITITCPATQSAFPQTATDLLGSSAVTGGSSSTVVLVTVVFQIIQVVLMVEQFNKYYR